MTREVDSQDFLAWMAAESLITFVASTYPGLTDPDYTDSECDLPRTKYMGVSWQTIGDLIAEQRAFECNFLEGVPVFDIFIDYGLVFKPDNDMHITCSQCAIIKQDEDIFTGIELCGPLVDGLIRSSIKCSLADRIRLFTMLVRLGCKAIGFNRDLVGFRSDLISFLRKSVSFLSFLVSGEGKLYSYSTGDNADNSADASDCINQSHSTSHSSKSK